ncbi:MAG: hypothetical protein NC925_01575 [Candidatus Omnitrophica bacterium]|nr:hypothetical protein [Candidatus Omnitrophota bacterium]MCM8832055.1 hypothetical protein [Candidatus Omnitrophota bacterium]
MKKSFTLVEVIALIPFFSFLFTAILTILISSDRHFRLVQNKLIVQQEARRAMDNIALYLRCSSPAWNATNSIYPLTISENKKRIDFYVPYFYPDCCPENCTNKSICKDENGNLHNATEIKNFVKVTFKLNPNNPKQLLRKEGLSKTTVVAKEIKDIFFNGPDGCVDRCEHVNVKIETEKKNVSFYLESNITLRNKPNSSLLGNVTIEEPTEEEL